MSIVIKAEHVSKYYKLGVINNGTLFRDIQTWWALQRGKGDPHSRIGEDKYDATKEGFWALKDLDFEIQQGDRVGIIGKNGAGKSTLLKILSRITAPTEGKIKIKGRIVSLLEVGTGFHGELTGRENIYLNGAILGMKRREITRKIDEIIAFSEIEQHIDTPVKRYSSGMYVRLAFAVAAHLNNEILIADEVLAVGDASFQKKALGKMNDLSTGQGRTVLFVSHNMNAVKNLCNKGILIEKGRILKQSDSIDEILSSYLGIEKNTPQVSIRNWKNSGKDYNEYFSPERIEVLDSLGKNQVSPLDSFKEYHIRLSFTVKKLNSLLDFYFLIYEENEKKIKIFPEQNYEEKIVKGLNIFDMRIPPNFLLSGNTYTFVLGSSIRGINYLFNPFEFDIFIDIPVKDNTLNSIIELKKINL